MPTEAWRGGGSANLLYLLLKPDASGLLSLVKRASGIEMAYWIDKSYRCGDQSQMVMSYGVDETDW